MSIHISQEQRVRAPIEMEHMRLQVRTAAQRVNRLQRVVERLKAKMKALEDENDNLRASTPVVSVDLEQYKPLGLTRTQKIVFHLLMTKKMVSKDMAMSALYAGRDDPPYDHIINVLMAYMRAKLEPYGVRISNKLGQGWFISEEHKDIIRSMTE